MDTTPTPKRRTRKLVTLHEPNKKADGFAIGVSQEHYWIVTALAKARNTNRMAILGHIIEQYARETLSSKESS